MHDLEALRVQNGHLLLIRHEEAAAVQREAVRVHALELLGGILQWCEALRRWPRDLQHMVLFILAKDDGGGRPIGLLSHARPIVGRRSRAAAGGLGGRALPSL